MGESCLEIHKRYDSLSEAELERISGDLALHVEPRQRNFYRAYGWVFGSYLITAVGSGLLRLFGCHETAQSLDEFSKNSSIMLGVATLPFFGVALYNGIGKRGEQERQFFIAENRLAEMREARDTGSKLVSA